MNVSEQTIVSPKVVKFVAAVVIGLSVGTMLSPEPMALPAVGQVPSVAVGAIGLVLGSLLFSEVPRHLQSTGCGCGDDCGCS